MQHTESIKLNKEFRKLYYRGKSTSSPFIVLYYLPARHLGNRNTLGITVSTKVGKAVRRNKIRRWIKEAYRSFEPNLRTGYMLVILARKRAGEEDVTYWDIKRSLGG
ncbi:MAG: ribonuclease P protein component, partial [Oscillospiraceae bacterium]|nr:ribonuclease P protein component [Oscillospiraceae bacterium]